MPAVIRVARAALLCLSLSLLVLHAPNVLAQDVTPPDLTVHPYGGTSPFATDSIQVDFCDDTDLDHGTLDLTLNNGTVAGSFTQDADPDLTCGAKARYSGVISLLRGANVFSATMRDNSGNLGSAVYTFRYGVWVNANDYGRQFRASTSQSTTFRVLNTSAAVRTFNLSASCSSGASSCSVSPTKVRIGEGGQKTATVTFTSGSLSSTNLVALTATDSADNASYASEALAVSASTTYLISDLSIHNYDNHQVPLCAAGCFAARQAMSTVPYFSLGQARGVTIAYDGDAASARPVVAVDVSLAAGAGSLSEWWLEAKDSTGSAITFVNGDTKLRFSALSPTTTKTRLAGQFDAGALGYTSGVYPITLVATAKYASTTEAVTFNTYFMVVNERKSPVARGWTILGVSRIRAQGTNAFLTEGDGSALLFTSNDFTGGFYSPAGDYSRLSSSGSGGSLTYLRTFPDSSRAEYDNNGYLQRLISRTYDTTSFTYDGSGRVTQISDPFRTNGSSTHLYWRLVYTTAGLDSIVEPGPGQTQSGGRATDITIASGDSTLTSWKDPDNVTTSFAYDGSKRLSTVTDRAGDVSTITYNSTTWKVDSLHSPSFSADPRLYGSDTTKKLKTKVRPWQTVAVPTSSTVSTTFTSVNADTVRGAVVETGGQVTAWTVDRWGQPKVTTQLPGDALQRVTTITRQPMSILADSVRTHEGMLQGFEYDRAMVRKSWTPGLDTVFTHYSGYAQPDSTWDSGSEKQRFKQGTRGRVDTLVVVGNGTTYKTSYAYDSRYRVTSATDPSSHTTYFYYNGTFGGLDSSKVPGSRLSAFRYDSYGRDTASTSPGVAWTRRRLDLMNRDTLVIEESGTGVSAPDSTFYTYSESSHQMTLRDPLAHTYTFKYNALGVTTQEIDPLGYVDKYFVDSQGRVSTWRNRNNDSVFTTYDLLHRPLIKSVKDNSSIVRADTLSYNANGLSMLAKNLYSKDSVYFDSTGFTTRVKSCLATGSFGSCVVRTYSKDSKGRVDTVNVTYPGSIAATGRKYVYDAYTGVLTAARVNGSGSVIGRNGELLPNNLSLPGSVSDTVGTISTHEDFRQAFNSSALNDAFWRSVNVDARGRIDLQFKASNGTGNTEQRNLFYDIRGRLRAFHDSIALTSTLVCEGTVDQDYGASLCNPAVAHTFQRRDSIAYDKLGNVSYILHSDSVASGLYGGTPGYDATDKNRLTSWPKFTFVVDSAGNRTRRAKATGSDTTRYYWSVDGLLDSVKTGSRVVQYDYNALGQLVRRRIAGTADRHYFWDRDNLLAELNSDQTARRSEYAHYPGLDQPLALLTGATSVTATRFLLQDQSGNVMGLTTTGGAVDNYVAFSRPAGEQQAWGGSQTLTDTLRLGWKGLLWEADSTQLYYMRARWYDPITRRFLTQDPIGLAGGMNRYEFAGNDPVNGGDPTGLQKCYRYSGWRAEYEGDRLINFTITYSFVDCVEDSSEAGSGVSIGPKQQRLREPDGFLKRLAKCSISAVNLGLYATLDLSVLTGVGTGFKVGVAAGQGVVRTAGTILERTAAEVLAARYLNGARTVQLRQLGRSANKLSFSIIFWGMNDFVTGDATVSSLMKNFVPFVNERAALREAINACYFSHP